MSGSCYSCRYKLGPIELHVNPRWGQSRCGKGPSISIYFACKLVSSGYAYSLNIEKFSCMVLSEMLHQTAIVNFVNFDVVDCSGCKFYTVIELLTNI